MKHLSLFLLIIGIFSCNSVDKLTQFDLPYTTKTTIPSVIGIDLPFNLPTPAIKTNVENTYSINNTKKDLVEAINLKSLELTLSGDDDFNFLKSIKIFINAEGLDELEIATKSNIDKDIQTLELDVHDDVNLMDYIHQDNFKLKVQPVTKKVLFHDVDLGINAVFHVNAKILGV